MTGVAPPLIAPRPAETAPLDRTQVWPLMSGILLLMALAALDSNIVSTALPRIVAQLNGFNEYAWVTTAYLLPVTITVPIYGKLADLFGPKPIFLFGTAVFLLGSILSGLAQSMTQLIAFRAVQGLGGGALVPVAVIVVGLLFPPRQRTRWQGITGAVWGIAGLLGPALGGYLTDNFSWRWIFYVNVPTALAALVVIAVAMPPLRVPGDRHGVDLVGAILLVAAVGPALLAISWGGNRYSWTSSAIVTLLGVGALMLVVFILYEARQAEPIVQPRLFRNRIVTVSVLTVMLSAGAIMATSFIVPTDLQVVGAVSASRSGTTLSGLLLAALLAGGVAGQLLSRTGRYRYLTWLGTLLLALGMGLLTGVSGIPTPGAVLPGLLAIGGSAGIVMTLYTIIVQNAVPPTQLGQVTAMLTFLRAIGVMLAIAATGSFVTAHYEATLRTVLPPIVRAHLGDTRLAALHNPQLLLQSHEQRTLDAGLRALVRHDAGHTDSLVLHLVRTTLADAIHRALLAGTVLALIACLIVLFLPEIPLRGASEWRQL